MTPKPSTPSPRRCCLAVPGSSARKLEKAAALSVDEIVIDLEDAVVPDAKASARAATVAALADWSGAPVAVRINAPRSPWCHADVIALAEASRQPHSLVLPKVEHAGDVAFVERLIDGVEAASGRRPALRVQALIETAAGLTRIGEIAAASPRLDALILGYADLTASIGVTTEAARDPRNWLPIQQSLLLAARANGLQAIDGPYLGTAVDDGLRRSARHAHGLGFDGKWAIHPAQVEPLQAIFSPTAEEVARARAVIEALDRAERQSGEGATSLDGEMLDEAMRVAALRVLARSEPGEQAGSPR